MRIYSFLSILLLSMVVLVWAGEKAKINQPAPDFELIDSNGKTHSLSDFKGKYVVLEWVNFGCPFVRKHYDSGNMQKLQAEYTKKDVVWLSICSSAEGKQGYYEGADLTDQLQEEKIAGTAYLIDEDGKVGKMYQAKTTPHMYIINPEGILLYAGGIDDKASTDTDDIKGAKNYVAMALDQAMAGKDIAIQTSKPYGCSVKYK